MIGVILPQGDICVLPATHRENIAYTRRPYKTRETHTLALKVKYSDNLGFYICLLQCPNRKKKYSSIIVQSDRPKAEDK